MTEIPRVKQVAERVNPFTFPRLLAHPWRGRRRWDLGIRSAIAYNLRAYILHQTTKKYRYGTSITSVSALCMSPQWEFSPMVIILNTFVCP